MLFLIQSLLGKLIPGGKEQAVSPAIEITLMELADNPIYDKPMHFIAIEALAKFFHPAIFVDFYPAEQMRQADEKFTSISGNGFFWLSRLIKFVRLEAP